ncbi:MAG: serine/threonine-protein kinase [Gemmatales bacterium]|nr:serine/threonine protein kinase [Gemmatales bacterium]MDW8174881.1 serine/threonine-protein kinase [Gemmatales bacterium]
MPETATCPKCGAQLPTDAPAGLCPRCLLEAGLETRPQIGVEPAHHSPTANASGRPRFVPPRPEQSANAFPQLEILELIGSGGMGAVYKARQPHLERLVALKILPPELGQDPAFEERFIREARVLAKLSHPHIIAVYDFGHVRWSASVTPGPTFLETGIPEPECRLYYLLMEYVDGTNLRNLIRTGHLQPKEALAIVPQLCDALQYAHEHGVVHRDIKPENVLLDRQGRVKIADFGLAKITGKAPAGEAAAVGKGWTLTATGQVMGTLHYMAPEQLRGSHNVDHRADIYSVGVVFYELLTGELPIGKFEPPSRKVQLDVRLDDVVLRALENEPERRYQRASDLQTDIHSITAAGIGPVEKHTPYALPPFNRPYGLGRFVAFLGLSCFTLWGLCQGLRLDVGLAVYIGAVAGVVILILLAWILWAIPYENGSLRTGTIRRVLHVLVGGMMVVASSPPWLLEPNAIYWLKESSPHAHDLQASFLFRIVAFTLTIMFLVSNWRPFQWLASRFSRLPSYTFF